jgi:putative membrane protein
MMGYYGGFSWIGMIIHFVVTLAVIIGLVLLVAWVIRKAGSTSAAAGGQTAREIARSRYAKGEITRDEYQQILKDLDK